MSNLNIKSVYYSKISLFFILLFFLFVVFKYQRWKKQDVIQEDTIFYYIYLPATFIYHDITFQYITDPKVKLPTEAGKRSWTVTTNDGHRLSKMTCGYALMHTPFFLIAHTYVLIKGRQADGYS